MVAEGLWNLLVLSGDKTDKINGKFVATLVAISVCCFSCFWLKERNGKKSLLNTECNQLPFSLTVILRCARQVMDK